MTYTVEVSNQAKSDIARHVQAGSKKLVNKIDTLMVELAAHPRTGTGQMEQLKHYKEREVWSRRIDKKHRLVYEIREHELIVIAISAYDHY